MIDLQALKLELETDPSAFGYGPFVTAGNHPELARMVNQSRVTITVRRPDVSVSEVLDVLDVGDFVLAPNTVALAWFQGIAREGHALRLHNPDGTDARAMKNLHALLEVLDTSGTRARLQQIASRRGSRAEQLFGPGEVVTAEQVERALLGIGTARAR